MKKLDKEMYDGTISMIYPIIKAGIYTK